MGRELTQRYPVYRRVLSEANEYMRTLGNDWDLFGEIPNPGGGTDTNLIIEAMQAEPGRCPIDTPKYAQPLCSALQIALVDLLTTWDIHPTAVIGHSSGEIAAA